MSAFVADALVLVGLVTVTLGVVGLFRMPDVYTQLHATGKVAFIGIVSFLLASFVAADAATVTRSVLIAGFLVLTTPVAAHAVARAAHLRGEPMRTPDPVDESGREAPRDPDEIPSELPPSQSPQGEQGEPGQGG